MEKDTNRKSVEESAVVDSGEPKEQRKSLLSRLASKRKSRDVKKEDTTTATPVVVAPADPTADIASEPPSTTVPAVVEPVESKASSEGVERSADAAPETLDRVESYHTGHHNDAIPSPTLAKKPDLERHITNIESSDGSSISDEWDEDDADERSKHGGLPVAGAGASGDAVAAAVPDHDEEHARNVAERVVSAPITDTTRAGEAPTATATSTTSADLSSKEENPVVATTPATTVATSAAPAVLSKPAPVIDEPRQSTASSRPSEEKEPKGFRGFFSKFRSKSRAENKLPAESSKATTSTGTTAAVPAATLGTAAITTTDASTSQPTDATVPDHIGTCLLYTSPSPRDGLLSRMPSSA